MSSGDFPRKRNTHLRLGSVAHLVDILNRLLTQPGDRIEIGRRTLQDVIIRLNTMTGDESGE